MATAYGLARGELTAAAFNANTNYLLSNWKGLTGTGSLDFYAGTNATIERSARRVTGLNGRDYARGYWRVSPWTIIVNTTMAQYIETTIWQGDISTYCTFSHYDAERGTWYVLKGYATRVEMIPENITTRNNNLLRGYRVKFSKVTQAS